MAEQRRDVVARRLVGVGETGPGPGPVGIEALAVRIDIVEADADQVPGLVGNEIADGAQPAGIADALAQLGREREAAPVIKFCKADIDPDGPGDLLADLAPVGIAGQFDDMSATGGQLGFGDRVCVGGAIKRQHRWPP